MAYRYPCKKKYNISVKINANNLDIARLEPFNDIVMG